MPKEDELTKLSKKVGRGIASGLGHESSSETVLEEKEYAHGTENLSKEQHEVFEAMLKEAGIATKVSKEKIKLTEDQEKQVDEARKQARGSAAVPTAVPGIPVNVPGTSPSEEAIEQAQEEKEAKDEIIEEENESIAEAVEEEKEHAEKKVSEVGKDPKGLLAFFTNNMVFIIVGIIDSAFSFGIGGDITMFFVLSVFWLIPSILLFDLSVYMGILFFLIIDLVVGITLGTVANAVPYFGDAAVDFIPELVVLIAGTAPSTKVLGAYRRKIPDMIAKIRQQSKIKIAQIRADGKERIKFALRKMRGHFSGVAKEGRKIIFFVFAAGITVAAQVFGLLGVETQGQINFTLIVVALCIIARFLGMLANTEFVGALAFIALNIIFKYILELDQVLSSQFGSSISFMITILFIAFSIVLAFKIIRPDNMPKEKMMRIMMVVALPFIATFLVGFVASGQAIKGIEEQSAQQKVNFENFNFVERLNLVIEELYKRGAGEYVPPAQQEQVHEYIGVKVADIEALRSEFVEGDPVDYTLYYSTGSIEDIVVGTSCYTGQIYGEVSPSPLEISNLFAPAVTCTFWSLPKGTHYINFESFYDYESTVEIPLVFMSREKNRVLALKGSLDQYEQNHDTARTSSGPIDFKVYTYKEDDVEEFKMPLVYDTNNLDLAPVVNIELDNPIGDSRTQGELKQLKQVIFDLPEGLEIGDCNFQKTGEKGKLPPTSTDDNRWKVDITEQFDVSNPFKSISCRLYVNDNYVNTYFPLTQDVTYNTLRYNIKYTYLLEQKEVATVS